jgi:hypothetical protein
VPNRSAPVRLDVLVPMTWPTVDPDGTPAKTLMFQSLSDDGMPT